MIAAATALFLVFLFAGCSAPPISHPDLNVPLPARWTAADAEALDWWDSFPGEEPKALVAEAVLSNWDLVGAAARLEAASAEARIAGAELYPQMSAAGNGSRRQQVFVGLPIPGLAGPLRTTSNSYGVSLDVAWELDLWGRVRQGRAAAVADFQAGSADFEGARLSIAGQTLKAWFVAVEASRQLAIARSYDEAHTATVERIGVGYRHGVRPSIDLRLAYVEQANAELALEQRRVAKDRAFRQLELLLGRYPGAQIEVASALPDAPVPIPAALSADLLARRPDLVAAERRLAAAGRRVSQSKRALLPQIRLTTSGGTASDDLADLTDGDFSVWSLAAGILQPVFQGGRLVAQVSRAGAREDEAFASYANAVLRACGEVEAALVTERSLAAQEVAASKAALHADAAHTLARTRYDRGISDILTRLSAQRADTTAKANLLQIRRLRLEARVDLHLALGGGFRLPASTDEEGLS